jgi:predicted hydrocarbon binding protein
MPDDRMLPDDRMMPNDALRILFLAIEEVMGRDEMRAALRGAKLERYLDNYPPKNLNWEVKFREYGAVEQAVEDFYGARGARAMLLRVGRTTFNYEVKEQSAVLGLAGLALKALPLPTSAKLKLLLEQMVAAVNKTVNQPAVLADGPDEFTWVVSHCMCLSRPKHSSPCCFVTLGGLTEAAKWLTDKQFPVREVTCINMGADACRFKISKTPE